MAQGARIRIRTARATLESLRQLERISPTPLRFDDLERALRFAIQRFFGSLERARVAARLRPWARPRMWSQAAVINVIRRLHREGVRISTRDLSEAGHYRVVIAACTHAGGLQRARRLAGVPEPVRRRAETEQRWDEETVVSEILALHRAGESLADSKAPNTLVQAGRRYFGSWRAAVEAAGLDYDSVRLARRVSEADLLQEIRELASRHPRRTFAEVAPVALKLLTYRRFGGIEVAAARAGLAGWGRRKRPIESRAATLRALRSRARSGKSVQYAAVKADDSHLWLSVSVHFATWAQALRAAKVPNRTIRVWNRRRVVEELRARHERGASMDSVEVRREDLRLYSAAQRYFGSYVAAAARYGARPHRVQRWARASLAAELRKLARARRLITPSLVAACQVHFGGLQHAFRAAGVARSASNRSRLTRVRTRIAANRQ